MRNDTVWALLPIKAVRNAKRRLAPLLSPEQRDRLCRAMAQDVLSVLRGMPEIDGVTLASDDPEVSGLARRFGCDLLMESELGAHGLNAVVAAAAARLARAGIRDLLVLHGDLPLISAAELKTLLATHHALGDRAVTIATDRHGAGTNCLVVSQAESFDYQFGEDSRRRHEQAARDSGRASQVLELPGISLDVDTPEDVAALEGMLDRIPDTRTARCLEGFQRR